MFANLTSSFRKFHSDEEGLEALQVVMIIAIAAMIMIAASTVGKAAVAWMGQKWTALQGNDLSTVEGVGGGAPGGVNLQDR